METYAIIMVLVLAALIFFLIVIPYTIISRRWKSIAANSQLTLKRRLFHTIAEKDQWQIRISQISHVYAFTFITTTSLEPFRAQGKGFMRTKWHDYNGIDTNATNTDIIDYLRGHHQLMATYLVRISCAKGFITYKCTCPKPTSGLKGSAVFDDCFTHIQQFHEGFPGKKR